MNKNLRPRQYLNEANLHIDGRNIPYSLATAADYLFAVNENWSVCDVDNFMENCPETYEKIVQIMALKQACVLLRHTSYSCGSLSDGLYQLKWELIKKLKDEYGYEFSDQFVEDFYRANATNPPPHSSAGSVRIRRCKMENQIKGLNQFAAEVHENAVSHGWWEEERSFDDIISLCHCELSEAMEEYRKGNPDNYFSCGGTRLCLELNPKHFPPGMKCGSKPYTPKDSNKICPYLSGKPKGVAVELADCILRILDYCGAKDIDIESVLMQKHEYNKSRPYKHGGKKL